MKKSYSLRNLIIGLREKSYSKLRCLERCLNVFDEIFKIWESEDVKKDFFYVKNLFDGLLEDLKSYPGIESYKEKYEELVKNYGIDTRLEFDVNCLIEVRSKIFCYQKKPEESKINHKSKTTKKNKISFPPSEEDFPRHYIKVHECGPEVEEIVFLNYPYSLR